MSVQLAHEQHWRDDETCSYCGSLSQDAFFAAIAAGCELGPTDKNYKVYVRRPDPRAGQPCIRGSANFQPTYGGPWTLVTAENVASLPTEPLRPKIGNWVEIGPTPDTRQDKFYFQHLDDAGRKRFVELLNSKTLNVGAPGHFYTLPFFVTRSVR